MVLSYSVSRIRDAGSTPAISTTHIYYMPKKLEQKLKREVKKKHPSWSKKRKDAYIYGTLRKLGWKPSSRKK